MFKVIFFFLLGTLFVSAQEIQTLEVSSYHTTPELWIKLLEDNSVIRKDSILNEQLVDLVECFTIDSVYKRKFERHQIFGGAMLPVFGVRWLTIKNTREKFVGTEREGIRIPGEERFTEYDVNWALYAHTPKYLKLVYEAYLFQIARRKGRKGRTKEQLSNPPYIEPTLEMAKYYRVHPEVTPAVELRSQLNDKFFPCIRPNSLTEHENFGEERPTIGVYGPWVLDCNHRCYPEIHPYEWIWWIDLHPKKTHPENSRSWLIGSLRDVSKRFKHWSSSPRVGQISVPFIFPMDADNWTIEVEHLAYSGFDEEGMQELSIPASACPFNFFEKDFVIKGLDNNKTIKLTANHKIRTKALQCWIGDINYDKVNNYVSGRLYLASSVKDAYTTRVTFQYE